MEFGKANEKELNNIDFSLPGEPPFNKQVLKDKPVKAPEIYIGCAKWGRQEWAGKIYPLKTKEKDFLEHYIRHYNSIELNATHYKVYDTETVKKWANKAGSKNFKFCPKMYKGVTHSGPLAGKEFITDEFLKSIIEFKEHLGPVFIQVSESFSPKRKDELFGFLKTLPADLQFFMEVRHPQWFNEPAVTEEFFTTLKGLNIGAVITDTAGRRDCAHMYLTVPKTFIRFVGNSLHKTDYTRIDEWIERVKFWLNNGLEKLYFFIHMHNEATSPELTVYFVDKLNKECGLNLQKPEFIKKQKELFD